MVPLYHGGVHDAISWLGGHGL
ncbi:hypothetical protein E2C01_088458 [Portunus trituberculatus]|uniref:Uncharacterized protein n=1 Tax=Portunus trituberculatus TaxID=210409 RepID=A0A5B7JLY3_PORTR|nr:hypothetical protein [Portunus trituberculatus]